MTLRTGRRGFALIDLLVAVTLVVMITSLALPYLRDDSGLRLVAAAEILTSDIELAQIMTMSNPADPVLVRIDVGTGHYWLANLSSPNLPIIRPGTTEPYEVFFGQARARQARDVTLEPNADTIQFNELGALDAPASISLRHGTRTLRLDVMSNTGTIWQSWN